MSINLCGDDPRIDRAKLRYLVSALDTLPAQVIKLKVDLNLYLAMETSEDPMELDNSLHEFCRRIDDLMANTVGLQEVRLTVELRAYSEEGLVEGFGSDPQSGEDLIKAHFPNLSKKKALYVNMTEYWYEENDATEYSSDDSVSC